MADRGEQRLRKRMYKPKQFQHKKKRPQAPRAVVHTPSSDNNTDNNTHTSDDSDRDEGSVSSEEYAQEEQIQFKRAEHSTASTSNVERALLQRSTDDGQYIIQNTSEGAALQEERATDLDQFLLDVDQPRPSPLITDNHESHDEELSQWLDSIAIKK